MKKSKLQNDLREVKARIKHLRQELRITLSKAHNELNLGRKQNYLDHASIIQDMLNENLNIQNDLELAIKNNKDVWGWLYE